MSKKILIILTSANCIPKANDKQTGWYLPELAHPYKVFTDAGFTEIDVISPKGGKAPLDESSIEASKDDAICKWFLNDAKAKKLVNDTKTPSQVKASDYVAVVFPGGHGPMFDLSEDKQTAKIAADVYENGGVVGAICHGPAGLIPVKLSNGEYLVKDKNLTCFSNTEEDATTLTPAMPFLLENELVKIGAKYSKTHNWQEKVVVDGRLVTGQNPASSTAFGKAIIDKLNQF